MKTLTHCLREVMAPDGVLVAVIDEVDTLTVLQRTAE